VEAFYWKILWILCAAGPTHFFFSTPLPSAFASVQIWLPFFIISCKYDKRNLTPYLLFLLFFSLALRSLEKLKTKTKILSFKIVYLNQVQLFEDI